MKKNCSSNWPKYVLQWGTLAALIFFLSGLAAKIFTKIEPADPETFCPFGGLQALGTYLANHSLPCSMTTLQIVMGVALAVAVILFSKLFCAYLCPIGTIEDLLTKLRVKLGFRGLDAREGSRSDKVLRIVKYGLLFWIAYMSISSSELFCKNLDPYYAAATGFKGEITLWMSITAIVLVLAGGLFVRRFWCKYVCPLGAVSNALKFWPWILLLCAVWWALGLLGLNISWVWFLGAFCLAGYLLEVIRVSAKCQILRVVVDTDKCSRSCRSCKKSCPYNIDVVSQGEFVTHVDCALCGECVSACPHKALSVSVLNPSKCRRSNFIPAVIAVVLAVSAYFVGNRFELPTIDVTWDVEEGMPLKTMKVENLRSVKCYGSSMAFKARMQKVRGVHGVKTFVKSHSVVLKYDPSKTNEEKITQEIFVPSHFRVWSPDPAKLSELKIVTIRTEKMYDKLDLNYLGLQFRQTGRSIFGVESEYNCPLIVHVYMSPEEELSEEWFREVVNKKELEMPVHGGGTKITPVDFEFVRMEKGEGRIGISEYLHNMFDPFTAEYKGKYPQGDSTAILSRKDVYAGKPQFAYEIADQSYEKPIIKRGLPFLSNHLSKEEGVIGTYLCLNDSLVPCIRIRYAAPMTPERIWELMTMDTWTITYKEGDVREESARMKFNHEGVVIPWVEK